MGKIEHRTPNVEGVAPCTLRLLSPALSSFGEERETEIAVSTKSSRDPASPARARSLSTQFGQTFYKGFTNYAGDQGRMKSSEK
jgi:hypothetical protein